MKKICKTFLVCVLFIFIALGSKVIVDDTNSYISGPLYGSNSASCKTYCVRGEKCTKMKAQKIPICTPVCGDGLIVKGKEECDDGNNLSGDGCSNCKIDLLYGCSGEPSICLWSCGNNIYEPQNGEKCDNGNSETQDGCSNICEISDQWQCPQNIVGLPSICRRAVYCGDGKINQQVQKCDDGNNLNGDGCSNCKVDLLYGCSGEPSICVWSCGNNIYEPQNGEKCDNGNSDVDDGCSNNCEIQNHWECVKNAVGLPSNCEYIPYCGDGKTNQRSQNCDDGNNLNGDGCSNTCQIQEHWECTSEGFSFISTCKYVPYCGDGIINQQIQKCDDGNNIDYDGCSATCEVVQTCIIDLEGKKYCYWDCTALYYGIYSNAQIKTLYLNDYGVINANKLWCNDYNSIAGDGCTKCQIDSQYSCLNFVNLGYLIYEPMVPQYQNTRVSYCTNCLPNLSYEDFFYKKCPPISQARCGDYILSQGEQCQGIFRCVDCKLIAKNATIQMREQMLIQLQNKLQTIENDNSTVFTGQDVLSAYAQIYKIPQTYAIIYPFFGIIITRITSVAVDSFIDIQRYYYKYYSISKSNNLGFYNFTMNQVKYFMEANNCSVSTDRQMFDNSKLFSNLVICTYNLYSLVNGQPNLKYDNSVPLMKQFVENVLNSTLKQLYEFLIPKFDQQKINKIISLLQTEEQFKLDVANKAQEAQGISEAQYMKNKLTTLLTSFIQLDRS